VDPRGKFLYETELSDGGRIWEYRIGENAVRIAKTSLFTTHKVLVSKPTFRARPEIPFLSGVPLLPAVSLFLGSTSSHDLLDHAFGDCDRLECAVGPRGQRFLYGA
jgi:hypothetical protein